MSISSRLSSFFGLSALALLLGACCPSVPGSPADGGHATSTGHHDEHGGAESRTASGGSAASQAHGGAGAGHASTAASGGAATEPPSSGAVSTAPGWLTYRRSGGIAGLSLWIQVDMTGHATIVEGPPRDVQRERALTRDERKQLATALSRALTAPTPVKGEGVIADGQTRLVTLEIGSVNREIDVSDGMELDPAHGALVRLFEEIGRPEWQKSPQ